MFVFGMFEVWIGLEFEFVFVFELGFWFWDWFGSGFWLSLGLFCM